MAAREKAVIAITMGDASGVGPEVIVKSLQQEQIYDICLPVVLGEAGILQEAISLVKSPLKLHPVRVVAELERRYGVIDLFDLHNLDRKEVVIK